MESKAGTEDDWIMIESARWRRSWIEKKVDGEEARSEEDSTLISANAGSILRINTRTCNEERCWYVCINYRAVCMYL